MTQAAATLVVFLIFVITPTIYIPYLLIPVMAASLALMGNSNKG